MTNAPAPNDRASTGPFGAVQRENFGWRGWLFPAVFLIYLAQTAAGIGRYSHGAAQLAGWLILAAFVLCYLRGMMAGRSGRYGAFWYYYAAMIALCAAETFFAHQDAFVMLVYIAVLSVASRYRKAVPLIAAMIAISIVVPQLIGSWRADVDYSIPISIGIVSLAMFGFFGLVRANEALAEARTEVARLAAENERSRIARDLHDLLGHSLTTITVKAGLANRIAERDPMRAAAEIAEVESLARQALTDVRAAVSGYREVTLGNELAAAREVLRAAGITAELPGAIDSIAATEAELFAWVLREGVTNVVRHSRANTCKVRLSPHAIEITDDGVGSAANCGNGLTGLRERVAEAGGTLTVDTVPSIAGWRLRVEVHP